MNKIYKINNKNKYYPKNILKLRKHPKELYVMGNLKILDNPCVGIVGSRDNTSYGEFYASLFAKELSKAGITVVSGLALGIDTISHVNSMKEKGKTIAVIGSGFNNIYPTENIEVVNQIIKNGGAIISEYPPETEVNLSKYPARNRLIAGLSECVIVVEAKFRSGSSITAKHASKQGKKVFCVPGRIGDKTGKGTNNLIKKGAYLITDINEILELFGKDKIKMKEKPKIKVKKEFQEIYKLISKSNMTINEISRTLNLNISELNTKITMMELNGLIEILSGNMIKVKE